MNFLPFVDTLFANKRVRIITMSLLALLIFLIGYEAYHAYMMNHTYYFDMLGSAKNW